MRIDLSELFEFALVVMIGGDTAHGDDVYTTALSHKETMVNSFLREVGIHSSGWGPAVVYPRCLRRSRAPADYDHNAGIPSPRKAGLTMCVCVCVVVISTSTHNLLESLADGRSRRAPRQNVRPLRALSGGVCVQ